MVNILPVLLHILLACTTDALTSSSSTVVKPTNTLNATCPFRTINYITHGLPQQCLKTSWKAATSVAAANATQILPTEDTSTISNIGNATWKAEVAKESGQGNGTNVTRAGEFKSSRVANATASSQTSDISSSTSSISVTTPSDTDEPSPLDDSKFMSFEEWKKQNLQKAGQSEHLGRDARLDKLGSRKRSANIHTALDSLGDEGEIDLDFAGFIPDAPDLVTPPQQPASSDLTSETPAVVPAGGKFRSKDAGTTCKERFNYASFDCAAQILKHNPEASSAAAVLGENKDVYMLNQCSANNKFLILELCEDIRIDTIVLANFEFFSSIFRTFRVSVSDKYPVKIDKWTSIGTFEARHTRDVQAFLVENPMIWARYVRIEFLTHYGSEYYCPLSLVRVHGTTMLEEYKRDQDSPQAEDDAGDEVPGLTQEPAAENAVSEGDAIIDAVVQESAVVDNVSAQQAIDPRRSSLADPSETPASVQSIELADGTLSGNGSLSYSSVFPLTNDAYLVQTCAPTTASNASTAMASSTSIPPTTSERTKATNTSTIHASSTSASVPRAYNTSTGVASSNTSMTASQVYTKINNTATMNSTVNSTNTEKSKQSQTSSQAQASPTMQESFFKSVQKRLQMLETNSSLSLQYIEDQSRALRDAFNKVEQRQLGKTTTFLENLNATVLNELRDFRQQYDQLWQSTVIELESQRERYQHETAAVNARLGILADEVIFQKRMSIVQMILILVCLSLVLFSRGSLNHYLEMPLVQHVLSRSPSTKWLNLNNLDTPTQSPPMTRQSSLRKRHGILKGHRRMRSEDSIESSLSPEDMYSPATPVSLGAESDAERQLQDTDKLDDPPDFDPSTIERPSTSPPILHSTSTPSTPQMTGISGTESIETRLLNSSPEAAGGSGVPKVFIEGPTPPTKHLTWSLPGG